MPCRPRRLEVSVRERSRSSKTLLERSCTPTPRWPSFDGRGRRNQEFIHSIAVHVDDFEPAISGLDVIAGIVTFSSVIMTNPPILVNVPFVLARQVSDRN